MSISTSASFQCLKEWFDHSSLPSIKLWFCCQTFTQAVLLISISEQRLSFRTSQNAGGDFEVL